QLLFKIMWLDFRRQADRAVEHMAHAGELADVVQRELRELSAARKINPRVAHVESVKVVAFDDGHRNGGDEFRLAEARERILMQRAIDETREFGERLLRRPGAGP